YTPLVRSDLGRGQRQARRQLDRLDVVARPPIDREGDDDQCAGLLDAPGKRRRRAPVPLCAEGALDARTRVFEQVLVGRSLLPDRNERLDITRQRVSWLDAQLDARTRIHGNHEVDGVVFELGLQGQLRLVVAAPAQVLLDGRQCPLNLAPAEG